MNTAAALILGYLFGSIPFGLIVTRLAGTPDIRAIGSGNIGATNVLRTGRKSLAAITLLGDILKGTVAVLIAAALWSRNASLAAALGAVLGHVFPVWLRFKGGKGVATYIGVLLAIAWPAVVMFAAAWAVVAAALRYSSLAGLVASALTPAFLLFWTRDIPVALVFLALTVLLWVMHRANITRLINGTEPKISKGAGSAATNP